MVAQILRAFYLAIKDRKNDSWEALLYQAKLENPWFTTDNIEQCLKQWEQSLEPNNCNEFIARYHWEKLPYNNKKLGLILAGNIPAVGMHDVLMGLCSGFEVHCKLSSNDSKIIPFWIEKAIEMEPTIANKIKWVERLENIDFLVVTGNNNTANTFNQYFKNTERIIRQNRNSLAVITGNESDSELAALGSDIFSYFGLGCRNVTHIIVPQNYNFKQMIESWGSYTHIINHHKYANNYTYHKALLLMNLDPHIDFGFGMLHENKQLYSPVSIVHYSFYNSTADIQDYIQLNANQIQCIVGSNYLPFGTAQNTMLWDFADGVNTLEHWL